MLFVLGHFNVFKMVEDGVIEFEYELCVSRFALLLTSCQMKKILQYSNRRKIMIKRKKKNLENEPGYMLVMIMYKISIFSFQPKISYVHAGK